jgi:formylglycine-generating enzyme required for sulfatase activity
MACERKRVSTIVIIAAAMILVFSIPLPVMSNDTIGEDMLDNLVFIEGGSFPMGDVFAEGDDDEFPVHQVTVSDFYIAKYEVTIAEFRLFVLETRYVTGAEKPDDPSARSEIIKQYAAGDLTEREMLRLHERFLLLGGAGYWDANLRRWTGYNSLTTWRNPGISQTDSDPVMAVSQVDAMAYCNWRSKKAGIPIAYDLETGEILDDSGDPTHDVSAIKGYRLPTEAEWEYAARDGGEDVRFGNGKNLASSLEINLRGDEGEYEYLKLGAYAGTTKPVGSYSPNRLGLYDMSGNAWEWVSDRYAKYSGDPQIDPYITTSDQCVLRGGRWGGDAYECRVFHRSAYPQNDRCNNSGFRVARSSVK